jgi:hypothetical protein
MQAMYLICIKWINRRRNAVLVKGAANILAICDIGEAVRIFSITQRNEVYYEFQRIQTVRKQKNENEKENLPKSQYHSFRLDGRGGTSPVKSLKPVFSRQINDKDPGISQKVETRKYKE